MDGWGKLGAEARAEAKGAEIKILDEQEWAVSSTYITAQPLISPVCWQGANERRWHAIGH